MTESTQPTPRRETRAASRALASTPAKPATQRLVDHLTKVLATQPKAVFGAAAGVIVLALCAGSIAAGAASARQPAESVVVSLLEPPAAARAVPAEQATPQKARTCMIELGDESLATFAASVVNATTGEILFDRGDSAVSVDSLHKVVTAAVALQVLGPDARIPTRVYEGSIKGSIVLVGGGDPTLSALPVGAESVYAGAPRVSDLATQTKAALAALYPETKPRDDDDRDGSTPRWPDLRPGEKKEGAKKEEKKQKEEEQPGEPEGGYEITELIVDASLWGFGDKWDSGWPTTELAAGTQSNITPLMVDGDRADPTKANSARGADPVASATNAFIASLGLTTEPTISHGVPLTEQPLLAEVYSQPISVLVTQMLRADDNTLADMLARLSSKATGADGSAASLDAVYRSALTKYGVPVDGVVVKDGSGLNTSGVMPTETVARLLAHIPVDAHNLQLLQPALRETTTSGTLAHRFTGKQTELAAAFVGTGGETGAAHTLGGVLTASDGAVLAVALHSSGAVTASTPVALELVVAELRRCGDNLSNAALTPSA